MFFVLLSYYISFKMVLLTTYWCRVNRIVYSGKLNRFNQSLSSYQNRQYATYNPENSSSERKLKLLGNEYQVDEWTNVPLNIKDKLNRNLLHTKYHPLNHLANKIKHFFYKNYVNRSGTPLFSVYDSFKPIVSVEQNFDRLKLQHKLYL